MLVLLPRKLLHFVGLWLKVQHTEGWWLCCSQHKHFDLSSAFWPSKVTLWWRGKWGIAIQILFYILLSNCSGLVPFNLKQSKSCKMDKHSSWVASVFKLWIPQKVQERVEEAWILMWMKILSHPGRTVWKLNCGNGTSFLFSFETFSCLSK